MYMYIKYMHVYADLVNDLRLSFWYPLCRNLFDISFLQFKAGPFSGDVTLIVLYTLY